jgi:hypothetical protein
MRKQYHNWSRRKPLPDSADHLRVIDQVAAVGGGDAPVHAFDILSLFEHTGNDFVDYLSSVFALAGG